MCLLLWAEAYPDLARDVAGDPVLHGDDVAQIALVAFARKAHEVYAARQHRCEPVEERAIVGAPVDALVSLAEDSDADLLVVGNVGLSTIAGRLLGSVPANVSRRAKVDVLIVHTTT